MNTDVHYHKQPHTLDPAQEPPEEEAPRAQGHTEDDASDVREAIVEHKEIVEAEAEQEEVTARDPGDHAGETSDAEVWGHDSDASDDDDSCPPNGTIDEVKAWVGDDHDRAQQALEAERSGQNRTTLVSYLESI